MANETTDRDFIVETSAEHKPRADGSPGWLWMVKTNAGLTMHGEADIGLDSEQVTLEAQRIGQIAIDRVANGELVTRPRTMAVDVYAKPEWPKNECGYWNYVCIGGPFHSQVRSVSDGARRVVLVDPPQFTAILGPYTDHVYEVRFLQLVDGKREFLVHQKLSFEEFQLLALEEYSRDSGRLGYPISDDDYNKRLQHWGELA